MSHHQEPLSPGRAGDAAPWDRAALVFFALFAVVTLATFRDYGYSWDEAWQNRWYGQAVLRFFSTFGKDLGSVTEYNFHLYGGTFDVLAEGLVAISPLEPRNARHLANLLAGWLCLLGTWKTARLTGGPAAGFWAAVFLAVCAPFYGHSFINAKDIPFAAGYIWGLYWLLRLAPNLPAPPLRERLCFALTTGLTLGIRIGGAVLLLYYCLLGLTALRPAPGETGSLPARILAFARASVPVVAVAYLLMLLFWPAALLHPLAQPLKALQATTNFEWPQTILWNGRQIPSNNLPWSYLPVLFAVELPEVLVLFLPCAAIWAAWSGLRPPPPGARARLLLVALFFPPLWAIANKATLYDNMRHFLFVLPPLCCLGGLAFAALHDRVRARFGRAGWLPTGVMLLGLALPTLEMASLHPYEYTYLNLFAGGMPEGAKRFETDYWVTSYREAAALVEDHARRVATARGLPFEETQFTVALVASPHSVEEILPRQFRLYEFDYVNRADYLVATTRWGSDARWPNYPVIGTVGRHGIIYAVVKASPEMLQALATATR